MKRARDDTLARSWRGLVEGRLPRAAQTRTDWPVRHDHCFARILLDNACGEPWRNAVAPPAWMNAPDGTLRAALALGEAVLAGKADLTDLNRRSLAWRGKDRRSATAGPGALTAAEPPRHRGGEIR